MFIGCKQTEDTKGETIPPESVFYKIQNDEILVSYLTKILESQEGANVYYLRAKAYFSMRAYQKAHDDIEQALKQVPGDVDFLLLSAQIKNHNGLITQGIEDAKLVESSGLASSNLYLCLSELYLANNEKKLGYMYLRKLESLGIPESARNYVSFLNRNFRSDSLGAMQLIKFTDIGHPTLSNAYFSYQLGRIPDILFQKQILAEIRKYPLDPILMYHWGHFLAHMGQYARAENVYKQTLSWLPNDVGIRLQMVRFYIDRKQFDAAEKMLLAVSKSGNKARDVMYLRALIAINSGKKSIGIALLDSARRIYVSDGRFLLLYNRLVAKKNDSAAISIDSTNQMAQ
jgi:tetratricopeptide (TPR) repeat protein